MMGSGEIFIVLRAGLLAFIAVFGCLSPSGVGVRVLGKAPGAFAKSGGLTPILTYHDFIDERGPDSLWFDCTTREFLGQISWLRTHNAHFVTLDQVYAHLVFGKSLPKNAIALTAADGYEGFYLRAAPILREYRIPLTMFVHTGFVGGQQGRPKMDWDQLRALDREGLVAIQSETVSHRDLPTLSDREIRREMVDSKRVLESHLGHPIRYIAYPDGKYDARSEAAAAAAGYEMAFCEVTRPAEESKNRWSVDRYVHTKWRQAWRDCGRKF